MRNKSTRTDIRFLAILMLMIIMSLGLISCSSEEVTEELVAGYGEYGAAFAKELASNYPYRKPYTEQEASAAAMIEEELVTLGYNPEVQSFSNLYGGTSQNIIVRIEGQGFMEPIYEPLDSDLEIAPTIMSSQNTNDEADMQMPSPTPTITPADYSEINRIAVIGAHYDSALSQEEIPEGYTYDGIDDNASGVGCLMTIAKQIRMYTDIGFDVYLVFFGAGNDGQAGSRFFYESLPGDVREEIEVMYCIDGIYAGDKVYANAGLSSLNMQNKYELRRRLYQAYDVCYDNPLYSTYGFDLIYNESNIYQDINGDGTYDYYREVTLHESDHRVFDEALIPVVLFDSGDYFYDSLEEIRQTKNLYLQDFGGQIGNTPLDSFISLDPILNDDYLQYMELLENMENMPTNTPSPTPVVETDENGETTRAVRATETTELEVEYDRLETRINCVAFIIMGCLMKGSDDGITIASYDALVVGVEENK